MLQYYICFYPDKMLILPSVFSSAVIMEKYMISLWAAHSASSLVKHWDEMVEITLLPQLPARGLVQPVWPTLVWLHWRCWGALLAVQLCTPGVLLTDRITLQLLGWVWVHTWMSEVWFCLSQHIVGKGRHSEKESPFLPYNVPYSLMQYRRGIDKKHLHWQNYWENL